MFEVLLQLPYIILVLIPTEKFFSFVFQEHISCQKQDAEG